MVLPMYEIPYDRLTFMFSYLFVLCSVDEPVLWFFQCYVLVRGTIEAIDD